MFARSFRKRGRLGRLQRYIVQESTEDVLADFRKTFTGEVSKRAAALEKYLDLCAADSDLSAIRARYQVGREDLRAIYQRLSMTLGNRAALSTIAYAEPLLFYLEATRREMGYKPMLIELLAYWDGATPRGSLCSKLPAAPVTRARR